MLDVAAPSLRYCRLFGLNWTLTWRPLVRVVGSVEIDRPASQVWAYVADYGNDPSWRAAVTQMRPSVPGPAQVGVTTHERLRLLGMTFRTDAIIGSRPDACWRGAPTIEKQLQGSRLVEPTSPTSSRFTEVVEGGLLGLSRPLGPLVAWVLQRQATADLQRLKHLLETQPFSRSSTEEPRAELGLRERMVAPHEQRLLADGAGRRRSRAFTTDQLGGRVTLGLHKETGPSHGDRISVLRHAQYQLGRRRATVGVAATAGVAVQENDLLAVERTRSCRRTAERTCRAGCA